MESFTEKTVKQEYIYKGKIIDLSIHDVVLPDGNPGKREIVSHPGAVAVLAVTEDEKIVLVNQYRKPLEKVIAEIPAGKLEKGEEPLECAKRELEEETGFLADKWTAISSFYTSPGFADEIIYLFLAEDLKPGQVHTDEDEFVECVKVTLGEALELMKNNIIHDAKTIIALQYLQLRNQMR
ncbi:ADP-ribose pyrophosphatase [Evansella caseinilytica]|uniref:ADP-ribose pyrophosphatase n=1 Tax=Evansella caseinilytica TaxID=1503961 RepID=A0A1H3L5E9_9BACI|nr:NUDIX hydrolase [Evansella caseinilytica]SDY59496.1 ADP-ribose pyrophosphatase [Evansella caseinilytica]